MKVFVDPEICTGCGLCVDTCPDVYELTGDVAKVKVNPVPANAQEDAKRAAEECPVEAIKVEG